MPSNQPFRGLLENFEIAVNFRFTLDDSDTIKHDKKLHEESSTIHARRKPTFRCRTQLREAPFQPIPGNNAKYACVCEQA